MATTNDETIIEVDPGLESGTDSFYSSTGYLSSTQSLSSSINEHIFENGRRYHTYYGENKNMMPTDETEQDRLDLHHEIILRMMNGRLYDAPIDKKPQKILDVGTGTGIWAIDMADAFPSAEVIGTDIAPLQPKWVPPNCRFEMDDAEQPWTFASNSFDLIHIRNIAGSISDWDNLMNECYRCVKPGGWFESAELGSEGFSDDGSVKDDNAMKRAFKLGTEAIQKIGRDYPTPGTAKGRLEAAGFVDVREVCYKQPLGPWPKDKQFKYIGAMALVMLETGIEAYVLAAYTRILGMDPEEAAQQIKEAMLAVKDKRNHMYNHFYVAYGRKPEVNQEATPSP